MRFRTRTTGINHSSSDMFPGAKFSKAFKMKYMQNTKFLLALILGICHSPLFAQHPDYRFEKILSGADAGVERILDSPIEVLEDGRVLFVAEMTDFGKSVLLGDANSYSIVSSENVLNPDGSKSPGVIGHLFNGKQANDFAEIALIGNRSDATGSRPDLFGYNPITGLTRLYSGTGGQQSFSMNTIQQPSVNNVGQIAFIGGGQTNPSAIFLGDFNGILPAQVIATSGAGPFGNFRKVVLLDSGEIVATATRHGVRSILRFTGPGEAKTLVQEGPLVDRIDTFFASDSGFVAFLGRIGESSDKRGVVVLGDETGFEIIFEENEKSIPFGPPGINDFGNYATVIGVNKPGIIAFSIQIGPDLETDSLIAAGDFLFGQEIVNPYSDAGSINNCGQIAFTALALNTDTMLFERGVYLATPVLRGDVNLDGVVNLQDIAPFISILANGAFQVEADINGDGVASLEDIPGFIDLLAM